MARMKALVYWLLLILMMYGGIRAAVDDYLWWTSQRNSYEPLLDCETY